MCIKYEIDKDNEFRNDTRRAEEMKTKIGKPEEAEKRDDHQRKSLNRWMVNFISDTKRRVLGRQSNARPRPGPC